MTPTAPRFAVVSAVYNVKRFLPEFLASLDAQTFDHSQVQVVLVDDGSTDGSAEALEEWSKSTDLPVILIVQENAGQGAARNAGLLAALDADWITFIDPDDFVAPNYFEAIERFLGMHPEANLAVGHQQDYIDDGRTTQVDNHPLRFRFADGDRLVDLEKLPRNIQLSAATAFFRSSVLREHADLRFDGRIRPNFEDGHFVNRYLLQADNRNVGFVDSAAYHYRRRADGTSTIQTAAADPRKYTDVLEYGYLDLLRRARELFGHVPEWIQITVIYDLTWILRADEQRLSETAGISPEVAARFQELARQCRAYLDDSVVQGFDIYKRSLALQEAMLHGFSDEPWRWNNVLVEQLDEAQGLLKLRYRYTGKAPQEVFFLDGVQATPRHTKVRAVHYLQRAMVFERIVWIANNGRLSVRLDGETAPLSFTWPQLAPTSFTAAQIRRRIGARKQDTRSRLRKLASKIKHRKRFAAARAQLALEQRAKKRGVQRRYKDAWVLMDRDNNANDSGEHLFKYLRDHHREVNAWFVLREDSADWQRLKAEGVERMVAYGSTEWKLLCLNATNVVSSHADGFVYQPFRRTGGWKWKFTFLQHGVTKDDLSRWLGGKPIRGIITSTVKEHASFAGPSDYPFSTREVVNTGMPRFDRLRRLAASTERRRSILVMPTWRQYLVGQRLGSGSETAKLDDFAHTDFALQWAATLDSPVLRRLAEINQLDIVFMPHPNLMPYIGDFSVPDHVRVTTYAESDVQTLIAEAALMITDYSSVAFDAALVGRPVAYFQFDRDEVFGGKHNTRPGYFAYRRDGFGPVTTTLEELEHSLPGLLETPGVQQAEYAARAASTFGNMPENSCEAVVEFIRGYATPLGDVQAHVPVPEPEQVPIAHELNRS